MARRLKKFPKRRNFAQSGYTEIKQKINAKKSSLDWLLVLWLWEETGYQEVVGLNLAQDTRRIILRVYLLHNIFLFRKT